MSRPEVSLEDGDYIAEDGLWVTIKGFSIRVKPTDEGVAVDIYELDKEDDEAVASCYAFDNEIGEDPAIRG